MTPVTVQEREAFYRAAAIGLRALDARERTPRRFGADPDARWKQFAGALGHGDRLDILLRDAAGAWGAAFSPSECFGFFGLADDEPFGPDWSGVDDRLAKKLFSKSSELPALDGVADTLGVASTKVAIPKVSASTKIVVAGGAALVAVAKVFAAKHALSWNDQVAVIADKTSFRQLAGLAAVLLGAPRRTVLVRSSGDVASSLRAAGFAHLDARVISSDAEPAAAEVASNLGGK